MWGGKCDPLIEISSQRLKCIDHLSESKGGDDKHAFSCEILGDGLDIMWVKPRCESNFIIALNHLLINYRILSSSNGKFIIDSCILINPWFLNIGWFLYGPSCIVGTLEQWLYNLETSNTCRRYTSYVYFSWKRVSFVNEMIMN